MKGIIWRILFRIYGILYTLELDWNFKSKNIKSLNIYTIFLIEITDLKWLAAVITMDQLFLYLK